MTDPRRRRFAPYLRRLADLLALKDWCVEVHDEPPGNPDAVASSDAIYGRRLALIRLSEQFLDDPPEEQRHTLAHELIHCHFDAPWKVALESIAEPVVPAWRRLAEHAIDGLADAIAPLLPLPDSAPAERVGLNAPPGDRT